jgi:UDP-N-acetylglucosamine--N-acetylmuramyl-(pentapeptide) pyrophosphoryl-undecaprenol N-acetylglucosamine transferase
MKNIDNIIFAAGGTGGHIFPALAIAEEFLDRIPNVKIHFVGTSRGLESKIIPKENYPLHLISIGRLNSNVSFLERIKTLIFLPWAIIQSFFIILKLKPSLVVGVGGYATGPVVLVASLLRYPTFIWEPNAFPGMANRYLAPFVNSAIVVFKEAAQKMKVKNYSVIGYPLRRSFNVNNQQKLKVTSAFKIFIFGGSQGARAINSVMKDLYEDKSFLDLDIEIVHQTGSLDYRNLIEFHKNLSPEYQKKIQIKEFIYNMPDYYLWADIAICRSGMGTVSELAATGVPAIFIPLPFSADDHQVKNAESMMQRGAAKIILQKNLSKESLKVEIENLMRDSKRRDQMSNSMTSFFEEGSTQKIVDQLVSQLS